MKILGILLFVIGIGVMMSFKPEQTVKKTIVKCVTVNPNEVQQTILKNVDQGFLLKHHIEILHEVRGDYKTLTGTKSVTLYFEK